MLNKINKKEKETVRIKPLNYTELHTAFERLMRFSSPFDKMERVYRRILIKNSIEPKINSRNFWNYEISEINRLFQHIWNESVKKSGGGESYEINLYLAFEELKAFSAAEFLINLIQSGKLGFYKPEKYALKDISETEEIFRQAGLINTEFFDNAQGFCGAEKLFMAYRMKFPLNIHGFLEISSEIPRPSDNIKRLKWLNKTVKKANLNIHDHNLREKLEKIYEKTKDYRRGNAALNPVELLVLAEGATEETLLPVFSKIAGIDFEKNGPTVGPHSF